MPGTVKPPQIKTPQQSAQPVTVTPVGVADSFSGLAKAIKTLSDPKIWLRVGMLAAGFVLTVLGFSRLMGDNQLGDTTKTAIKIGKAVVTKKVK